MARSGKRPKSRGLGWWALLIILAVPGLAAAAEFSAQMVVKDGDKIMPGKIYVQDGKMRQEFLDEAGQTVTIVRPDKKVIWVLMPQEKTYFEMPLKARLPGQFIQIPPEALQKRLLGTETVNGYVANKFEVTVRGGKEGMMKQTIWEAQKLGVPIKAVCGERDFSIEYRNIKEGPVAARLFNLPPGFKKIATPTSFTMKVRQETE